MWGDLDASDDEFDIEAYALANPRNATRKRFRKWGLESLYRQQVKARSRQLLLNAMRALQENRDYVEPERGHPMTSCDEMAMLHVFMRQQGDCMTSSRSDFTMLVDAGVIADAPHPNTLGNWRTLEGKQARGNLLLGALNDLFRVILLPVKRSIKHVIVDSTGLSINGNANWIDCEKGEAAIRAGTAWARLHVGACRKTKIVPAFRLTEHSGKDTGDCSNLIPILEDMKSLKIPIRSVSADKIYSTDEIFAFIIKMKADPIIPMKWTFNPGTKIFTPVPYAVWIKDRYENRRQEFESLVGPRSIIESTIHSIKGRNDERLWARKPDQRVIEVTCMLIAHNIRRLVWREIVDMQPLIDFGNYADEIRQIIIETPPKKKAA